MALIFIGWILVIHDWLVNEGPKVSTVHVPKPGNKIDKLKARFFKPRSAFEKRHWREDARPEDD